MSSRGLTGGNLIVLFYIVGYLFFSGGYKGNSSSPYTEEDVLPSSVLFCFCLYAFAYVVDCLLFPQWVLSFVSCSGVDKGVFFSPYCLFCHSRNLQSGIQMFLPRGLSSLQSLLAMTEKEAPLSGHCEPRILVWRGNLQEVDKGFPSLI